MNKRWKIKSQPKAGRPLADIIKILLQNRNLKTKKEIAQFLDPPLPKTPGDIKKSELQKAVFRIKKAIKNKEPIIVYGDYDADGICATAVLWEALHSLGAKALPFIPDRIKHGYGLSKKGIDELLNNETMKQWNNESIKLIITVDNGIVAHKAIEYAKSKGIEVIVTDHHQKKDDLPKAEAIVWSDKIAGVGVAWVLTQALAESKKNLDLVAIGTVADMMPLLGLNRSFVKYGLEQLNKTNRVGLQALFEEAGLRKGQISTWQIGYLIAPRLNAMGRLEQALDSLRLLCTRNKKRASDLSKVLGLTNKERQELTLSTFENAKSKSKVKIQKSKIIFIAEESYNQGVIGLVAGRLVEAFYRPAIVVSKGEIYSKASVRSVKGFNIIEFLRKFEDLLEDLGGHPMAAGFTVKTKNLTELSKRLEEMAVEEISDELLQPVLEADMELDFCDINRHLFSQLRKFEPFGIGNPQPSFVSHNAELVSFRQVGAQRKHLKLCLQDFDAIAFNHGHLATELKVGQKVDILYTIEEDTWNGNNKLQLKIRDIKKS